MHTAKLLVATALFLPACGGDQSASLGVGPRGGSAGSSDTPDGTLELAFDHLENERISAFVLLMAPPEELQRMKDSWAEMQRKPLEEADDAEFRQTMGMLTAEGAEDVLFAMVQPNLAEAQKQLGNVAGMAPMMAAGAIQESGAPEDTLVMIETIGAKLASIDIASEEKAKKAIAIVCKAAREINVKSGAEMQKLSFEQAMKKADIAYAGVVDALAVYGLDFDETFQSLEARVVSSAGDTAEVEVSVSLFGLEKKTIPVTMERKAGRWFPKKDEAEGASSGMTR
ncbi:MAG: hypothetical protein AAGB93_09160 [Planctomycetota bacterium]